MEIKTYLKIGVLALALAGVGHIAGNYIKNREIPKTDNRTEVKKILLSLLLMLIYSFQQVFLDYIYCSERIIKDNNR